MEIQNNVYICNDTQLVPRTEGSIPPELENLYNGYQFNPFKADVYSLGLQKYH